MASLGKDIEFAAGLLRKGELVAIPTETVYGLAGNALQPEVVVKIFAVKNRPSFDPVIVHVPSFESCAELCEEIPAEAAALANRFWPGPLTILVKKRKHIPDLVTAGLSRVGIRCPDHPDALALLRMIHFPLAAPSANPFGYVSPTTSQHVQDQLGEKISYILEGGPCRIGIESTIVGWELGKTTIHRLGGISQEKIESVVGPVSVMMHSTAQPQAPGQLKSHYAPHKKFLLGNIRELALQNQTKKIGTLSFQSKPVGIQSDLGCVLSTTGDENEAARNLFSMMRMLDQSNVDIVLAEEVPEKGLGRAINDRLRRAAQG